MSQDLADEAIRALWLAAKERWPLLTIEQFTDAGFTAINRLKVGRHKGLGEDEIVAGMMEGFVKQHD